jgi:hypothetical protein
MHVPRRNIPDLEGLSLDHSAATTFVQFDQSFQIGSIDSSDGRNAGLQDPHEAYLKIGSLRPSHYVFHSGCGLSNNCHPSGKMDGKTKSLYPVAEVDRLTKPYSSLALFAVPLIVLEPVKPGMSRSLLK